ncbi:MAG: hypothetical protein ACK5P7_11185 [Bdellovibrio sp.]
MKHLILPIMAMTLLAACSPETATVQGRRDVPPPQKPIIPKYDPIPADQIRWITLDGGQSELDFNPKVDILFVSDNSESMKSAQENLSRNINRFVDAFQKNKMIDYHIGVVSVWDSSERFVKTKKDGYAIGELRKLKNASGQISKSRFVSRFQGASEVLAATLKIGIAPYAEGGPEREEMFSPLLATLKNTADNPDTKDFFREDAQLVVVMISDADDSTASITPEQMAQELINFKAGKREKVSAYGALVKKSDPEDKKDWGLRVHERYHPECFDFVQATGRNGRKVTTAKNNGQCKEGFGPDRLENFILAANEGQGSPSDIRAQHIMSLVQTDFGKDLAKIGADISIKTLAKDIRLPQRPRQDANGTLMLRVRYGSPEVLAQGKGQIIAQSQKGGWLYDPDNNSVKLSGDVEYNYQQGARFAIDMVPVTIRQ